MCVICVKPAGVPMPALAEIKAMAEANPHGFGFCTSTGKFYKSTDFAIFAERLADVRTDEACVMHFRFAFLRGTDVLTFGKWFEMDGCLYSNLTWLYYVNNRRFVYSPTA